MGRAFGIAASQNLNVVREVALLVEDLGYTAFWTNDTPAADGIMVAAAAQSATSALRVGIGVMPIDRRPVAEIAEAVGELDPSRTVIGIGSGFSSRPLKNTIAAAKELRVARSNFRIAIAAMGPRMCRAAGEVADVVLFNWMTPERIVWALDRCAEGGARRDKELPALETIAYVRTALGRYGTETIAAEAQRYGTMPHYRRHFGEMGADPETLGVVLDRADSSESFRGFEDLLDETVVRALPRSVDDVDEILAIARAAAPR